MTHTGVCSRHLLHSRTYWPSDVSVTRGPLIGQLRLLPGRDDRLVIDQRRRVRLTSGRHAKTLFVYSDEWMDAQLVSGSTESALSSSS